jgi:hypothetical protein
MAEALRVWLPHVIQALDPWMSEGIDKGARWGPAVAEALEGSRVGIVCLTRDNLGSKWIHFEAGALAKTKDTRACTFLLDVENAEVELPLAQFQHTSRQKDDVLKLLKTINAQLGAGGERPLSEEMLEQAFDKNWSDLDAQLTKIAASTDTPPPTRSHGEMLAEILETVRTISTKVADRSLAEIYADGVLRWQREGPGSQRRPRSLGDELRRLKGVDEPSFAEIARRFGLVVPPTNAADEPPAESS